MSITLTIETIPPPSISGATRASAQWNPNTSAWPIAVQSICCTATQIGNAVSMLAVMVMRTSTLAIASAGPNTTAGRTVTQSRSNALENSSAMSMELLEGCVHSANAAYTAHVSTNRYRGGFQHESDIVENVRARQRFDQLGAGGYGGAAVAEIDAGQYRSTEEHRWNLHGSAQRHRDHTHRRGRSER